VAAEDADVAPPERKKKRGRPPVVRDFYGSALDAAQRTMLRYAEDIEGLDMEIDLLRVKLRDLVARDEKSFQLMVRGMELLAKLVSARYRLSKQAEQDIADSAANLLRGLAVQLFPEAPDDS
jgi:hypothetical protein